MEIPSDDGNPAPDTPQSWLNISAERWAISISVVILYVLFGPRMIAAIIIPIRRAYHRSLARNRGVQLFPLLRSTPTRQSPKLTYDILSIIFSHVSPRDLASCSQANQLFFEASTKALYGSREGVLAGRQRVYTWAGPKDPDLGGRNVTNTRDACSVFSGLDYPANDDTSNIDVRKRLARAYTQTTFFPPSFVPFQPSKLKLRLLRQVRHITYQTDRPMEFDGLISTDYFPLLETLTVQQVELEAYWHHPFLRNLRPKHIRLTHIRNLGSNFADPPYPLDTEVGCQAEKVTLHFLDFDLATPNDGDVMDVQWPARLKQVDLVFMASASPNDPTTQRRGPVLSFSDVITPPLLDSELSDVAEAVGKIISSACNTGAKVRLVGLGGGMEAVTGLRNRAADGGVQTIQLRTLLEAGVGQSAMLGGRGRSEAQARVDGMEYVTLDEYREEQDFLPYRSGFPKLAT